MAQRTFTLIFVAFFISVMGVSVTFSADEDPSPAPTIPKLKLQQVTISATKTERDPITTPGEVSVIDQETFQQRQAQSLDDVLRYEPGIDSELGPRPTGCNLHHMRRPPPCAPQTGHQATGNSRSLPCFRAALDSRSSKKAI